VVHGKDDLARQIAKRDAITQGLICVVATVELATCFAITGGGRHETQEPAPFVVDIKRFAPAGARSCLVLGHIGLRSNPKRGIWHFGHSGLAEGQIHAWVSCKHT
jgi:hypothetical protein